MKEVDEEIFDSSRLELGDGKENKEVSHVSVTVEPRCVDLIKDQFPNMVDRMPSPTMISSPIKAVSINSTNPWLAEYCLGSYGRPSRQVTKG